MTPSECTICNVSCGPGLTVTFKDLKGKWQQHRYCRACALHLGELQDDRAQASIAQAEKAGA
jgi:hypothetical protein